jgi:hypothetical protein
MLSNNAAGLPPSARGPLSAFLNRPDHLTRAASELARWDATVRQADEAVIDPAITVLRVEAAGPAQTALLTDPAHAAVVTQALRSVVSK